MEIEYKPEPGERWIPYYLGEKQKTPKKSGPTYTTLVRCPCCGGTHVIGLGDSGFSSTGTFDIICEDCEDPDHRKIIGKVDNWKYNPYSIPGIWSDKELEDYRVYLTMSRMDEIKEDFDYIKTDDGIKIHKTKSGKYIVVEGIV